MPVVPWFMTCDLCDFLGDALTLGRSTDTYFFDARGVFARGAAKVYKQKRASRRPKNVANEAKSVEIAPPN